MYDKNILTSIIVVFNLSSGIIFKKSVCLNATYYHCSRIIEGYFISEPDLRKEKSYTSLNDIEPL